MGGKGARLRHQHQNIYKKGRLLGWQADKKGEWSMPRSKRRVRMSRHNLDDVPQGADLAGELEHSISDPSQSDISRNESD